MHCYLQLILTKEQSLLSCMGDTRKAQPGLHFHALFKIMLQCDEIFSIRNAQLCISLLRCSTNKQAEFHFFSRKFSIFYLQYLVPALGFYSVGGHWRGSYPEHFIWQDWDSLFGLGSGAASFRLLTPFPLTPRANRCLLKHLLSCLCRHERRGLCAVLQNSVFCQSYINNNLHLTNWKRKQERPVSFVNK
jgi:hypothetical protein